MKFIHNIARCRVELKPIQLLVTVNLFTAACVVNSPVGLWSWQFRSRKWNCTRSAATA